MHSSQHFLRRFNPFVILLVVFISDGQAAVEHSVPIGTAGNMFLLTIKNPDHLIIKEVNVAVQRCPDWIRFGNIITKVDSISSSGEYDVKLIFDVENVEEGREGTIHLAVTNQEGRLLTKKTIPIKAVLSINVSELKMFSPYPNPANPSTTITFSLPETGHVKLEIFNVLGQRIAVLTDEEKPAGQWNITWNGNDEFGHILPTGVYVAHLQTMVNGKTGKFIKKVMILK